LFTYYLFVGVLVVSIVALLDSILLARQSPEIMLREAEAEEPPHFAIGVTVLFFWAVLMWPLLATVWLALLLKQKTLFGTLLAWADRKLAVAEEKQRKRERIRRYLQKLMR
jgi:hypothetical protein